MPRQECSDKQKYVEVRISCKRKGRRESYGTWGYLHKGFSEALSRGEQKQVRSVLYVTP